LAATVFRGEKCRRAGGEAALLPDRDVWKRRASREEGCGTLRPPKSLLSTDIGQTVYWLESGKSLGTGPAVFSCLPMTEREKFFRLLRRVLIGILGLVALWVIFWVISTALQTTS
jgi:hypothetical protein